MSGPRTKQPDFLKELAAIKRPKRPTSSDRNSYVETTIEMTQSPTPFVEDKSLGGAIKIGNLVKTSQSRGKNSTGQSRQRKFRLTRESLDYLQTFSHVRGD